MKYLNRKELMGAPSLPEFTAPLIVISYININGSLLATSVVMLSLYL